MIGCSLTVIKWFPGMCRARRGEACQKKLRLFVKQMVIVGKFKEEFKSLAVLFNFPELCDDSQKNKRFLVKLL